MTINDIFSKCDAILITSPHNLRYFSGFRGGEGFCLIGEGFKKIFVDSRYTVEALEECAGFDVVEYSAGKLYENINSILRDKNINILGFEDKCLSYAEYKNFSEKLDGVQLLSLGGDLDIIRSVKTEDELSYLKAAEEIGDKAFSNILPLIKIGMRENDLAAEIEYQMRKLGASGTSFSTIAISGAKTAMPHGIPSEKRIEYGDFVTMDFGCVYGGYCSDMTRTVAMGDTTPKQREVYDIVLKAQLAGLDVIRAGVLAKDADAAARDIIKDAGYGDCFGHSLGHGVGLMVHELPSLSTRSDVVLEENMVVTCEPGIYINGEFGVRIEDMVVVKNGGIENLTSSHKGLIVCE